MRCGAGYKSFATPCTSATSLRALLQLIESWAMSLSHKRSTTLRNMSDGSSCNAIAPRHVQMTQAIRTVECVPR